jgi:hypothetical protein
MIKGRRAAGFRSAPTDSQACATAMFEVMSALTRPSLSSGARRALMAAFSSFRVAAGNAARAEARSEEAESDRAACRGRAGSYGMVLALGSPPWRSTASATATA